MSPRHKKGNETSSISLQMKKELLRFESFYTSFSSLFMDDHVPISRYMLPVGSSSKSKCQGKYSTQVAVAAPASASVSCLD